jgi:hypothetical protein
MDGQMLAFVTVVTWIPLYPTFTMMNLAAAHPPLSEWIAIALLLLWPACQIFQRIRGRADA